MSAQRIVTITNPAELLLAQLHEIRRLNAAKRDEIREAQTDLRGGEKEEARLQKKLDKLLAKVREDHQ